MGSTAGVRLVGAMLALAAFAGLLPACGGGAGTDANPEPQRLDAGALALEGRRVSGRDEALGLVAGGIVAPLHCSELAHAVLVRAFELRRSTHGAGAPAAAGDRWDLWLDAQTPGAGGKLEGAVGIEIEDADDAEGVILRGQTGHLRAVVRLDRMALGAASHLDGAIVLEASRTAAGAGLARRSRADVLSVSDGRRTMRWSYLDIRVGADQSVQALNVVSALPIDGEDEVWLDVTSARSDRPAGAASSGEPASGRYTANGVIGFLKARLAVQVTADGAWEIDVDNERDDRVDFVVHAARDEARRATRGSVGGLVAGCSGE